MTAYRIESDVPLPSSAMMAFDENSKDIERLLEIHEHLGGTGKGRRYQLEVLNKSAIVLICAIWEAYCEDIVSEAIEHIVGESLNATALPKELRKLIAKELKEAKNELAVWDLADDGWKTALRVRLTRMQAERARSLNTPNTAKLKKFFSDTLGIANITVNWIWKGMSPHKAQQKLDRYIVLRGEIAHRGAARDCSKYQVEDFLNLVQRLVESTGKHVKNEVKAITGRTPWSEIIPHYRL